MNLKRAFLQIWKGPGVDKFLHQWQRESFFDDEVQSVLMERHPKKHPFENRDGWAMPVHAWTVADQFSLGTRFLDATETDAFLFLRAEMAWFSRLLLAVRSARKRMYEWRAHPATILQKFLVWREARYPYETSYSSKPLSPPRYEDSAAAIVGRNSDHIEELCGALRTAMSKENKRRDAIMELWADCWTAYLIGSAESVTKTEPNK